MVWAVRGGAGILKAIGLQLMNAAELGVLEWNKALKAYIDATDETRHVQYSMTTVPRLGKEVRIDVDQA